MSHQQATHPHRHRPIAGRFASRSPDEPHRVATPLELFYDLVLVVAVAQAAGGLHHALAENHAASGVVTFSIVFFGVWWSWVNFTWFASAYDNDDVLYRLLVLVQMIGALVVAAGIRRFEQHGDLTTVVLGYVIMRLALVTLWLRVARSDPGRARTALRYARGTLAVQAAWIAALFVPATGAALVALVFTLAACEMLVPVLAERLGRTPWHAEHIVERYGLFTLITLGESILAASLAVRAAVEAGAATPALLPTIVGGLLIVFSFFWLYFDWRPGHDALATSRAAFLFGYGHYFVFASAAAVGAGLAVAVDHATRRDHLSDLAAGAAVAVPAALYLACLRALHGRSDPAARISPIVPAAILLTSFTGQAALGTGLVMGALTAYKIARAARAPALPA